MKKFLLPAFGFLAASLFFIDPALAQLVLPTDNPEQISAGTFWDGSLRQAVKTVINFILFFLGLVAVAFIIYGGFLYITSQGEDQEVEKAKNIIKYAFIGIVVVLISYALINTVLGGLQSGTRPE